MIYYGIFFTLINNDKMYHSFFDCRIKADVSILSLLEGVLAQENNKRSGASLLKGVNIS
jgi:hypothetical protein